MASRGKYLFVTPAEFEQWVREEAAALGAVIILEERSTLDLKEWDGTSDALFRAFRIYFAEERPDLTGITARGLAPGKLGWFEVDVPVVKGQHLQHIQIGVKSAYADWDNPAVLKFFDRFWRRWKKHFQFGLIGKNTRIVSEGAYFRDVGYSPGAADWVRNGGILCQRFGEYMIFKLPPEQSG